MITFNLNSEEFILQGRGECNMQSQADNLTGMDIYPHSTESITYKMTLLLKDRETGRLCRIHNCLLFCKPSGTLGAVNLDQSFYLFTKADTCL